MIVCIAEKPSVARDIAHVLGANTPHEGYMEGNGYQVTWTFGHLCTLKEPHDYFPYWRAWEIAFLPLIPPRFGIKLIDNPTYKRQFAVIEKLMKEASEIINCGDAGQEGELIQRWVMQMAKPACPVKRLWISSMTEQAIREGFANIRPQDDYDALYKAGLCRSIGDWLLGINATRLYTLRYRQQGKQVLSIGRVQTPTLAMVVKRQLEIDNFRSEPYWVLDTIYRETLFSQVSNDDTNATLTRFSSQTEAQKALETIKQSEFEIVNVEKKNGSEAAPRLFDLTSLQVECNRRYAFSAEETLKLIQSLYEKKVTTYPRVDTTYLSEDIYPRCPNILASLSPYAHWVEPLLKNKLPKSKKVFDSSKVTDHHAIIPTGTDPTTAALTREEKLVFDLVARRFIGVFYPACRFATTTVTGTAANHSFRSRGKTIIDEGWRVVVGTKRDSDNAPDDDEERELPTFVVGEHGPHQPTLTEKMTTPPKPYTEATLLRAMETAGKMVDDEELREALKGNGIGRPSTRAAIIETLFKRNYIKKVRKDLFATQTGIDLINIIQQELLKSAELTGQWEHKLREIEARRYDANTFVDELKAMVSAIVNEVKSDNTGRHVAQTETAAPADNAESQASKPKRTRKKAAPSTSDEAPKKKRTSKKSPSVPKIGDPCPLCGKGSIIKGRTAVGCSRWNEGCTFRAPLPPDQQ